MLCSSLLAGETSAQSRDPAWKAETRLYLSGMSHYWSKDDVTAAYDSLATTGEFRFHPEARSWYAGLFADYRYSTNRRHTEKLNIGAYINFGRYRWDARIYAFVNQAPHSDDTWLYAGRLRYRLAEDHKFGMETIGTFRNANAPQLLLAYYRTMSETLSVTLAAGRGMNDGPDLSARLELIWRVF